MFPRTTAEGEELPEAYLCCGASGTHEKLPHKFADLEDRFPMAKACDGPGDNDLTAEDPVEMRGMTLGRILAADERGKARVEQ